MDYFGFSLTSKFSRLTRFNFLFFDRKDYYRHNYHDIEYQDSRGCVSSTFSSRCRNADGNLSPIDLRILGLLRTTTATQWSTAYINNQGETITVVKRAEPTPQLEKRYVAAPAFFQGLSRSDLIAACRCLSIATPTITRTFTANRPLGSTFFTRDDCSIRADFSFNCSRQDLDDHTHHAPLNYR